MQRFLEVGKEHSEGRLEAIRSLTIERALHNNNRRRVKVKDRLKFAIIVTQRALLPADQIDIHEFALRPGMAYYTIQLCLSMLDEICLIQRWVPERIVNGK